MLGLKLMTAILHYIFFTWKTFFKGYCILKSRIINNTLHINSYLARMDYFIPIFFLVWELSKGSVELLIATRYSTRNTAKGGKRGTECLSLALGSLSLRLPCYKSETILNLHTKSALYILRSDNYYSQLKQFERIARF